MLAVVCSCHSACSQRARADTIKPSSPEDQVEYPDVVITVSVSFPRDHRRFKKSAVDFFVLGCQVGTDSL